MAHPNNGTVIKLRIEKYTQKYTFFSQFHIGVSLARAFVFVLALWQIVMIYFSNFNLLSKVTTSSFFEFELRINVSDISKLNASVVLRSKWHLLAFAFISFWPNQVNNLYVTVTCKRKSRLITREAICIFTFWW